MKTTILNSDSIVQKIWNSHIFTAWFERHCNEMEGHGKVKNLRAAKHRFESFSKPLGRVILWLPALLATANDIAVKREGAPEGQVAQAWLNGITSETLVTLAMLADAGDEGLALVRQVDDEQTDIACLQRIVADFLDHARFLWQDGGCFSSDGYTKHCHGLLADGLPVVVVRGHAEQMPRSCANQAVQRWTDACSGCAVGCASRKRLSRLSSHTATFYVRSLCLMLRTPLKGTTGAQLTAPVCTDLLPH